MAIHTIEHVQERDGDYFIGATRVTLGSAVAAWKQGGERPESVIEAFPSISRADAYAAIAFYLDHRQQLDELFAEQMREYERLRAESQAANPEFYADLRRRIDALKASGFLNNHEEQGTADDDAVSQNPNAPDPARNDEASESN